MLGTALPSSRKEPSLRWFPRFSNIQSIVAQMMMATYGELKSQSIHLEIASLVEKVTCSMANSRSSARSVDLDNIDDWLVNCTSWLSSLGHSHCGPPLV